MPSKRVYSRFPTIVSGGGPPVSVDPFTDAFSLKLLYSEDIAVAGDNSTFAMSLLQADSNSGLAETLGLSFPSGDYGDTNTAPTETKLFTLRVWLSGSSGGTNSSNANGQNDGTIATLQTTVAGPSTITMTSTLGASVPTATITSAIYRGWFKSVNTLTTSSGVLIMHSLSALFPDKTMFSNSALNTTVDRLAGNFTYDLIANGINTLAKLQSCQMIHKTQDAAAGVTPHVLTVDAGCIEIAGAF